MTLTELVAYMQLEYVFLFDFFCFSGFFLEVVQAQEDCHLVVLSSMSVEWEEVRIPATGLIHYTGISSSYSTLFPAALEGVIAEKEYEAIIEKVNETVSDYWPCDTCYFFGYGCSIFSLGLSVLIPHLCASQAEVHLVEVLESYSLTSKYYDRKISFTLKKSWFRSYIEIKFPRSLMRPSTEADIEDISVKPATPFLITDAEPETTHFKHQKSL